MYNEGPAVKRFATEPMPQNTTMSDAAPGARPIALLKEESPAAPRPDAGSRKRRQRRSWLVPGLALVLLVLAAIATWGWLHYGAAQQEPYVTAPVMRGDVEDTITALGNLQPLAYVDVGTQVSGQLRQLVVEVGDHVEKGDLLAELDPTVYIARVEGDRAQLLNLRAQLADKQAQSVLAQQQFRRQTNLMRSSATSAELLESAEAAMRSAAAQVDALKAQIQQTESSLKGNEANLGYTKIYAPMSGTIVSQTARQGQTLNASQTAPVIFRIADLSTMTVTTQVSEADIGKLRLGMEAYFTTLGNPDRRWYGRLRQILPTPEIVNNVVLYNALFDVPNPTGELMTQMSAQVFFVAASAKNVPVVPASALRPVGGKRDGAEQSSRYIVKVVAEDGTVTKREVTVGVTNRVAAEIRSGLEIGERVVIGTQAPGMGQAQSRRMPPRLS